MNYYSQPETEQDQWVLHTLHSRRNGTFLEIGAYDGIYHSNTLTLEQSFDWTGWLIEAVSRYATQAQQVRRTKVVNVAVGPDSRSRQFYVGNQWSGLKDFTRPNLIQGHLDHHNPVVAVPTVPLQTILSELHVPPVIDYLSIDVEGAEYPILESYFKNRPPAMFRCMTIEVGRYADDLDRLRSLLEPLGYCLESVRAWDAYFCHSELCKHETLPPKKSINRPLLPTPV